MVAREGLSPATYTEVKNEIANISDEIVVGSKIIRNHLINKLNIYQSINILKK